jgi:hypothetical protein
MHVWQEGCWNDKENPTTGPIGSFTGRFLLVPDFGTDKELMAAIKKQQQELMEQGRNKKPKTGSAATKSKAVTGAFI